MREYDAHLRVGDEARMWACAEPEYVFRGIWRLGTDCKTGVAGLSDLRDQHNIGGSIEGLVAGGGLVPRGPRYNTPPTPGESRLSA